MMNADHANLFLNNFFEQYNLLFTPRDTVASIKIQIVSTYLFVSHSKSGKCFQYSVNSLAIIATSIPCMLPLLDVKFVLISACASMYKTDKFELDFN